MKKYLISLVLGLFLLLGGGLLLVGIIRSRASSITATPIVAPAVKTAAAQPKSTTAVSGEPVEITIPSLGIDLPVIPGYYDSASKTWTLTTDKVQYATMTPQPNNEAGNTFIYGHYRKNVFASLHTITPNAQAIVKTANGHTFYYTLAGVNTVSPDDSAAVFNYQGKPILTIQTCTGLFYQNRQLFTFNLEKVA